MTDKKQRSSTGKTLGKILKYVGVPLAIGAAGAYAGSEGSAEGTATAAAAGILYAAQMGKEYLDNKKADRLPKGIQYRK